MSSLTRWMDRTFYPHHGDFWDLVDFRAYLLQRLHPHSIVLDYGAGRGARQEMNFRGSVAMAGGVDIDTSVLQNPSLDEAHVLVHPDHTIPYEANTFDVVFSANVMEHVQQPDICFKEIWRVLKPGGLFITKTPNSWHYMPLIARLTPHTFHLFYNRLRGREERDTFPTVYKCNTPRLVKRYAHATGFEVLDIQMWEGRPEYLRIAAPLYLFGYLYERTVNALPVLSTFRSVMIFTLVKH